MLLRTAYAARSAPTRRHAALAEQYLLWFIPAMALQFAMVAMGAALRGTGNFKPGMIVQTGTVIINIVLAPVLIFGWGPFIRMGVSGAAVATFVAIVVGVVVDLVLLPRPERLPALSLRRLEAASSACGGGC